MKTIGQILIMYWLCLRMIWLRIRMVNLYITMYVRLYLLYIERAFLVTQLYGFRAAVAVSGRRRVQGHSMQPTLREGDFVIAQRLKPKAPVSRGDILIFSTPNEDSSSLKRVCGLPGETVSLSREGLIVDGETIPEPYLNHRFNPQGPHDSFSWTLGPDELILLGDNRFDSLDSRSYGPVPRSAVVRRVVMDREGAITRLP